MHERDGDPYTGVRKCVSAECGVRSAGIAAEWPVRIADDGQSPGSGRAGAWDAACCLAAESAKADFAIFQRRIHSLRRAESAICPKTARRPKPGTGKMAGR